MMESQHYIDLMESQQAGLSVVIDPMCLLHMTNYHEKNIPRNIGSSCGILYALPHELTYRFAMPAPLGTQADSSQEIISRLIEFESIRNKNQQHLQNFYDQFILIGWYQMSNSTADPQRDQRSIELISAAFRERGAPYFLIVDSAGVEKPKLFNEGAFADYCTGMDKLEKYCSDTLLMQSSKKESVLIKNLNKQKQLLGIFNEKLSAMSDCLKKEDVSMEKKQKILEWLENYDRIEKNNENTKRTLIEAMNYSVLGGLILMNRTLRD